MESKRQRKGGWEGGKKEEREGRKTKSLLFQKRKDSKNATVFFILNLAKIKL